MAYNLNAETYQKLQYTINNILPPNVNDNNTEFVYLNIQNVDHLIDLINTNLTLKQLNKSKIVFLLTDEVLSKTLVSNKYIQTRSVSFDFLFYDSYEVVTDEDGNILTKIKDLSGELITDIDKHPFPVFTLCNEYKLNKIKENLAKINEALVNVGIDYSIIYMPIQFIPEYIDLTTINIMNLFKYKVDNYTSPIIYGLDTTEFKEKYGTDFVLNSNISKEIDTIKYAYEIEWLRSKYYEDVYQVKNIIKEINPLVKVELGIDYYMCMGIYPNDELLLTDSNLYSNFLEQLYTNSSLNFPFVDGIVLFNVLYDYIVGCNPNPTKENSMKYMVDIRTINERIELFKKKYEYPYIDTSLMIDSYGKFNDSSIFTLIKNLVYATNEDDINNSIDNSIDNSWSESLLLYEKHLRHYDQMDAFKTNKQETVSSLITYMNILVEDKMSILYYLKNIHIENNSYETFYANIQNDEQLLQRYNGYIANTFINRLISFYTYHNQ